MKSSLPIAVFASLAFAGCEGDNLNQVRAADAGMVAYEDATVSPPEDAQAIDAQDAATPPAEDAEVGFADASAPDAIEAPIDGGEEGCGTPTSVYATFNPLDRQMNIILSPDNLSARTTSTNDSVRATQSKSYGRWYFEVKVVQAGGSFNAIGVADGSAFLEVGPGDVSYGCGYSQGGTITCAFGSYRDWSAGPTYSAGTIVQVAVDLDRRRIYFGRDGTWINGQDPASLSDGFDIGYDPYCAPIFPMVNVSEMDEYVVNFGATPFTYGVPVGYEAGWFEDATCPSDHCGSSPVEPTSCTPVTDPALVTAAYPPSINLPAACANGYVPSDYTNTMLAACYSEEMHVVSVYEGDSNQQVRVHVHATPLPVVLVLNAYSSIDWMLDVDPAAQLDRVIVHGYEPQQVSGVPATTVLDRILINGPIDSYSYGWEVSNNGGGGSFYELISDVRAYTQMMELSFQGCYSGSDFTIPY